MNKMKSVTKIMLIISIILGSLIGLILLLFLLSLYIDREDTKYMIPWWIDIIVDSLSTGVTYLLSGILFEKIENRKNKIIVILKEVSRINISLIIGIIVHSLLEYWYIIIFIFSLLIIFVIKHYIEKEKKIKEID